MCSEIPALQIPVIEFDLELDPKKERWQHLCKRVREACEEYGCFEVVFDNISLESRAETFSAVKQVFQLPRETKEKNMNPKPNRGYMRDSARAPLYESLGIEDASDLDSVQRFTQLMWPNGHNHFCQSVNSMAKQMDELIRAILKSILNSYGLEEKSIMIQCLSVLRLTRYEAPPFGKCMEGVRPHTDKALCAIICDDNPGLEVETKDGQWVRLSPSTNSFIFLVGDSLMAWSNGRLRAGKHRVTMSGDKDRYSLIDFAVPLDGTIIKAPKELLDEQHPPVLKEFDYIEFTRFANSMEGRAMDSTMQVLSFAGN